MDFFAAIKLRSTHPESSEVYGWSVCLEMGQSMGADHRDLEETADDVGTETTGGKHGDGFV